MELISLQPDAEELEYRRVRTRPDLEHYREGYATAATAGDPYAARFYLDLLPQAERTRLEETAVAEREIAAGHTQAAIRHLVTAAVADPDAMSGELLLANHRLAALQAWFGEDQGLADTCGRALESARGTSDPRTTIDTAGICCLRPTKDRARLETALALARKGMEAGLIDAGVSPLILGMAEYRNGHFAAADAALIAAANDIQHDPYVIGTSVFYRAMSSFRQGREIEARQLATEAATKMPPLPKDEKNPPSSLFGRFDLILWMAYKEARALIHFAPAQDAPARHEGK